MSATMAIRPQGEVICPECGNNIDVTDKDIQHCMLGFYILCDNERSHKTGVPVVVRISPAEKEDLEELL